MKTKEITLNEFEAQIILFALEHEINKTMRDKNNDLDWITYKTNELQTIYYKIRKVTED